MNETPVAPERRSAGSTGPTTPESQAITAFTLAVLTLLGQTAWTTALQALTFGSSFSEGRFDDVMLWWGVSSGIVAVLAIWLARRVVVRTLVAWTDHVARAAIGLAGLGLLLAVVTVVGALVH